MTEKSDIYNDVTLTERWFKMSIAELLFTTLVYQSIGIYVCSLNRETMSTWHKSAHLGIISFSETKWLSLVCSVTFVLYLIFINRCGSLEFLLSLSSKFRNISLEFAQTNIRLPYYFYQCGSKFRSPLNQMRVMQKLNYILKLRIFSEIHSAKK